MAERIEETILRNLVYDEEFYRKVVHLLRQTILLNSKRGLSLKRFKTSLPNMIRFLPRKSLTLIYRIVVI